MHACMHGASVYVFMCLLTSDMCVYIYTITYVFIHLLIDLFVH